MKLYLVTCSCRVKLCCRQIDCIRTLKSRLHDRNNGIIWFYLIILHYALEDIIYHILKNQAWNILAHSWSTLRSSSLYTWFNPSGVKLLGITQRSNLSWESWISEYFSSHCLEQTTFCSLIYQQEPNWAELSYDLKLKMSLNIHVSISVCLFFFQGHLLYPAHRLSKHYMERKVKSNVSFEVHLRRTALWVHLGSLTLFITFTLQTLLNVIANQGHKKSLISYKTLTYNKYKNLKIPMFSSCLKKGTLIYSFNVVIYDHLF